MLHATLHVWEKGTARIKVQPLHPAPTLLRRAGAPGKDGGMPLPRWLQLRAMHGAARLPGTQHEYLDGICEWGTGIGWHADQVGLHPASRCAAHSLSAWFRETRAEVRKLTGVEALSSSAQSPGLVSHYYLRASCL